jgi:hypothetical protein
MPIPDHYLSGPEQLTFFDASHMSDAALISEIVALRCLDSGSEWLAEMQDELEDRLFVRGEAVDAALPPQDHKTNP